MLSLPETYYVGHPGTMSRVSTGLGGQANVFITAKKLSPTSDKPATYEVSVWLNRFGMICIGCEQFELPASVNRRNSTARVPLIDIIWHPLGTNVIAMIHGEVIFIQLYWLDKKSRVKISARDATVRNALGESPNHSPSIENQVVVRLIEQNRHSLGARSLSLGDGGRWLLVGSDHGVVYKLSWRGHVSGRICLQPTMHHEVFETWQSASRFPLDAVLVSNVVATNSYKAETHAAVEPEDDSARRHTEVTSIGDFSEKLHMSPLLMADGSVAFLRMPTPTPTATVSAAYASTGSSKVQVVQKAHCSARIHPVTLIKLARAKVAPSSPRVTEALRGQLETAVVTDAHGDAARYFGSGAGAKDIARLLKRGIFQPAVSRVTDLCLLDEAHPHGTDSAPSALLVVKVVTRHLLPMEMDPLSMSAASRDVHDDDAEVVATGAHDYDEEREVLPRDGHGRLTMLGAGASRRETTTLSVIRISLATATGAGAAAVGDGGGITAADVSGTGAGSASVADGSPADCSGHGIDLECLSTVSLQHQAHCGLSCTAAGGASLVILKDPSPCVLVCVDGLISCRPVGDLGTTLFQIDALGHSADTPPPAPTSSFITRALSVGLAVGFGRLLVVISAPVGSIIGGGDGLEVAGEGAGAGAEAGAEAGAAAVPVRPKVHVIPLLQVAAGPGAVGMRTVAEASPQQMQARGVLVDACEHRLLLLSPQRTRQGSFAPLPLPASILEHWRAQVFSASLVRALTPPGRRISDAVAADEASAHLGLLVALSASSSGTGVHRGYLAVVLGGQSLSPSLDVAASHPSATPAASDLWLYNLTTQRWRSTDLSVSSALLRKFGSRVDLDVAAAAASAKTAATTAAALEQRRRSSAPTPPAATRATPRPTVHSQPSLDTIDALANASITGLASPSPSPLLSRSLSLEHHHPSIDDDVVSVMSENTVSASPTAYHAAAGQRMRGQAAGASFPSAPSASLTVAAVTAPAGQALSQPSVLALAWFGEHSLVALSRRLTPPPPSQYEEPDPPSSSSPGATSVYYLEVFSRAPTKQSLRAGRPRPAVHRVVLLPRTVAATLPATSLPSVPAFVPRTLELMTDDVDGTSRCVAVVGDGVGQMAAFTVGATAAGATGTWAEGAEAGAERGISDYTVAPLWTCDLARLSPAPPAAPTASTAGKPPAPLTAATAAASIRLKQSISQEMIALSSANHAARIELPLRAWQVVAPPGRRGDEGGAGLLVVDRAGRAFYVNPLHAHSPAGTGTGAAAAAAGAATMTLADDTTERGSFTLLGEGPFVSLSPVGVDLFGLCAQGLSFGRGAVFVGVASASTVEKKDAKGDKRIGGFLWGSRGAGAGVEDGLAEGLPGAAVDVLWLPKLAPSALAAPTLPLPLPLPLSQSPDPSAWDEEQAPAATPQDASTVACPDALTFALPAPPTPRGAPEVPVATLQGSVLSLLPRYRDPPLVLSSALDAACPDPAVRLSLAGAQQLQQQALMVPGGGAEVAVRHASLPYHVFMGLVRIACTAQPGRNGAPAPDACVDSDAAIALVRRLLRTLQRGDERRRAAVPSSPITPADGPDPAKRAPTPTGCASSPFAQHMFAECLELRLKALVESPSFSSSLKQSDERRAYREVLSVLAHCDSPDAPLLCEVLSRLGRKLEPSVSHRLFPVSLSPPSPSLGLQLDGSTRSPVLLSRGPMEPPSIAMMAVKPLYAIDTGGRPVFKSRLTPLVLFEHVLSTRQLSRATRLLTLACEYVGGSSSAACASRSLEMALELLYETLRCLSLSQASACLEFCCRLQHLAMATAGAGAAPTDTARSRRARRAHGHGPGPGPASPPAADAGALVTSEPAGADVDASEPTDPAPLPPTAAPHAGEESAEERPVAIRRAAPRPKPPVSPELHLACSDNQVWRGVGGGLFSSLASVSPALSYYLGGTAVWAVQQTWRAISDQPRARTDHPPAGSGALSAAEDPLVGCYPYRAFTLATAAATPGHPSAPVAALVALLCSDLIGAGRFYCCAATVGALLGSAEGSAGGSAGWELLRRHALGVCLRGERMGDSSAKLVIEEEEASASTAAATMDAQSVSVSAASLEDAVLEVAKAFRLQKLLLPPPRPASGWFGQVAPTPEGVFARSPALATLAQQLVDRSARPGPARPHDTASFDAASPLISTEALARKLVQPLQLSHLRLKCEREMFALTGCEGAARLSGEDDDDGQATLVASDVARVALSAPSPLCARGGAAHRVLPRAIFAVSHVEVDSALGTGVDGEGVTATIGALVRRVGAALLLMGRVQEAAVVAAAILGRADIAVACRDVLLSSSSSSSEHTELSHGAAIQAAEQQALLRARAEAFDLAFEFFTDGL